MNKVFARWVFFWMAVALPTSGFCMDRVEFCTHDASQPFGEGEPILIYPDQVLGTEGFFEDFDGAYKNTHLSHIKVHHWTRITYLDGSTLDIGMPVWDVDKTINEVRYEK